MIKCPKCGYENKRPDASPDAWICGACFVRLPKNMFYSVQHGLHCDCGDCRPAARDNGKLLRALSVDNRTVVAMEYCQGQWWIYYVARDDRITRRMTLVAWNMKVELHESR
jgi:hypothetical protein